ncbi:GNAT family N-acetyltransferase [Macrococcoides canis]|nr:GNAT family N-acetyltransferase [Macrococcus canis]
MFGFKINENKGENIKNIKIQKLSQCHAEEIANEWKYEGIYKFYDATEDEEDYQELISQELRGERYFEVLSEGQLIGFFVVNDSIPKVVDYGLGMKPELTGHGNGKIFIKKTIQYILENYDVEKITLSVALFNNRAIKCYEKCGFIKEKEFTMETNGSLYRFVKMYRKC